MKKLPIDLSMLTPAEVKQFDANPTVLSNGDTNVALYMRYSSDRQSEQSIEGQLRDAIAFCKSQKYKVAAVYVDRATSAHKDTDKRVNFLQMISDSDKRRWQYVVVWKLDRFARNRNDSAIYKMRLRKNGVKVVSVTENISENPEGIILEAVLEGMAEFYSAELSQKIQRGMRESALKCQSIGGHIPLGYKIENHKYIIDPVTAPIVQRAFELYADGWTIAEICRDFNTRGYRTAKNAEFNRNSFRIMFRNKRYIGVYTYKGTEIEGGFPAIVDKKVFAEVTKRMKKNCEAPGRGKSTVDFLLSGKLFCGHCSEPLNGDSGTGKMGQTYYYYNCAGHRRKNGCKKKPIKKDLIETWVAQDAKEMLTDELIEEMADLAVSQSEKEIADTTRIPALLDKLKEIEKSIKNIATAIEKGVASDTLMNRLTDLEKQKKTIERDLAEEQKDVIILDRVQIIYWLSKFKDGDIENETFRRQLIDLLINSVTVWDVPGGYKITTAYNLTSCNSKTFHVTEEFGFSAQNSTNRRTTEHHNFLCWGSVCVTTKIHSLRYM